MLDDDVIMGHRPLFPFVQMRPNAFESTLEGVFALVAPLPTDDAYEALVGGLWSVVYGDPSEIAGLADSLADLAGDVSPEPAPVPADDPLTLTFEGQAGFYWDPNALSSVVIDWGDGA